jgi:hypothetical protein
MFGYIVNLIRSREAHPEMGQGRGSSQLAACPLVLLDRTRALDISIHDRSPSLRRSN